MIPYIVIGLVTGSIYSLAAIGLTLTYKTTGVFNFANGVIAAAAAYLFYNLHYGGPHLAWPLTAAIVIVVFGIVAGLILERLGSQIAKVPVTTQIVATVGLMVAVQAFLVVHYGAASVPFPNPLPSGPNRILGVFVTTNELITAGVVLAVTVGLSLLLRFTRLGVTTRAVVDDPQLLALDGINPSRPRRWSWCIGASFAALSGMLAAASTSLLDPTILTLIMFNSLGAVAIGRFRNLPLTYVGGLIVGVVASIATKYLGSNATLSTIPQVTPFVILFVALLLTPPKLLRSRTNVRLRAPRKPKALRPAMTRAGYAIGALLLLLAPHVLGASELPSLSQALADVVLFLSLGVLVRLSGQISLCQYAFAAIGAAAFSHLASGAGVSWPLAVIGAGLVTVPVGALIAIPAIRLSGTFLALATFGFGVALSDALYTTKTMFGISTGITAPRPGFAHSPLDYYYLLCVVVALCCLLVLAVDRSRLGRLLRGISGSPVVLTTHGASINVTKTLVFCLSAFLAGISGALVGPITGTVGGASFDPLSSLILLAVLAIAGPGKIRYAFVAAISLDVVPSYITNSQVANALPILFGVSAIGVALASTGVLRFKWPRSAGSQRNGGNDSAPREATVVTPSAVVDA